MCAGSASNGRSRPQKKLIAEHENRFQDNDRAIRFYQKQGFVITGEDKNSSGRLTFWMKWRP